MKRLHDFSLTKVLVIFFERESFSIFVERFRDFFLFLSFFLFFSNFVLRGCVIFLKKNSAKIFKTEEKNLSLHCNIKRTRFDQRSPGALELGVLGLFTLVEWSMSIQII